MNNILVIGNLNCDMLGRVDHMPEADEEVALQTLETFMGGSGANLAVVAARLGLQPALYAAVGDDRTGDDLIRMLDEGGVSTARIKRVPGQRSGQVLGVVEADGVRRLFSYRGANRELKADDISDADLAACGWLHLSSPAYDLAQTVLERARKVKIHTSMDPGSVLISEQPLTSLLGLVDVLFVNEVEFRKLSRGDSLSDRAAYLHDQGADWIVLKHQARGSALFRPGQPPVTAHAFQIQAVDTTGSGDAFNAAFLAAVMKEVNPMHALRQGNAAGAMNALLPGAVTGVPTAPAALEKFIRETPQWDVGVDIS